MILKSKGLRLKNRRRGRRNDCLATDGMKDAESGQWTGGLRRRCLTNPHPLEGEQSKVFWGPPFFFKVTDCSLEMYLRLLAGRWRT